MNGVYPGLDFPGPPAGRPYVVVNMVTTIDGKSVSGTADEPVADLGSAVDHASMRQIEAACDTILIGAGSLRATPGLWYPSGLRRIVVTQSGDIDLTSRFFADAPAKAHVIAPDHLLNLPGHIRTAFPVVWRSVLETLRAELGVQRLLIEGGSELNASVLREGLVDELFLSVAPKVKLGRALPSYAGGEPLDRSQMLTFDLVSCIQAESEVFLRYRASAI